MISELQQEQASLYVLGALTAAERENFEAELGAEAELRELVHSLQRTTGLLAMACPPASPPRDLRERILRRIETAGERSNAAAPPGLSMIQRFRFVAADDPAGWKQLPIPGASVKLLSLDRERGYAILLGRLAPGVRYPAHTHEGSEDLLILTGDLHIGGRAMRPGDFNHSDAATSHGVNYSVEGCTLVAVLSLDHALAKFAMA
jgi:anti-sigma factor ChrR (cupin superfamily)